MSEKQFLRFLQSLITMSNPKSRLSMQLARTTLESIAELAIDSGKCNAETIGLISAATDEIEHLIEHKDHFEGKPGDYANNKHKRMRLLNALMPDC